MVRRLEQALPDSRAVQRICTSQLEHKQLQHSHEFQTDSSTDSLAEFSLGKNLTFITECSHDTAKVWPSLGLLSSRAHLRAVWKGRMGSVVLGSRQVCLCKEQSMAGRCYAAHPATALEKQRTLFVSRGPVIEVGGSVLLESRLCLMG